MPTASYVPYSSGIDFGTRYLTKEAAYFLGNIFSSNESTTYNGQLYWIAPTRYNYGYASELEIEQHLEFVKEISAPMGAQTLSAEVIRGTPLDSGRFRLAGFGTFFKSSGLTSLADAIPTLTQALLDSPWEVQQSFLVGVFDGRGSIDVSAARRRVSLTPDEWIDDFGEEFYEHTLDNGFFYLTPDTEWNAQAASIPAPGIEQISAPTPEQLQMSIEMLMKGVSSNE